ncbi:unnamed protein product [Cuscuta epithymum]|uniref:Leucine-rich repeat-containing N-terminal plant-type domain-containing protein n=1 Tax=Cuscuta epithymum TaxID=186058 RepID=A0AAV0G122_9ASTE|nr:unnamed protein product [Cuscuta epithymum]
MLPLPLCFCDPFSVSGLNQHFLTRGPINKSSQMFVSWLNGTFSSWSGLDLTPCSWAGAECDCSGAVLAVSLSGYSLIGLFPNFRPLQSPFTGWFIAAVYGGMKKRKTEGWGGAG